jgi:hypothetical protein
LKSKEKKKILIISRSFYPTNTPRSFRTTELVKEFARQGHEITLLTVKDKIKHPEIEKEFGVKIKDLGSPKFKAIDISVGGNATILFKRFWRRILKLLFEYPDIELVWNVKRALKKESGYDLLISVAVPHPTHWGVAMSWKKNNSIANTWVADCGDPYMGATLDTFKKLFYFKYLEKAFCRRADYITVPIEQAKDGYYPEFRDKIEVIPQGFKFDDVEVDPDQPIENDVPTFAYAGGFIPGGRDPGKFLDYLVNRQREFKFIIYTRNSALVDPYLDRANGRIEIRDYIPRPELLKELSKMDFLVNFENNTSLQLPSKLIDYYLTGRPVLSVVGNRIDREAIDLFLEGDYGKRYQFHNVDQYRIENVCDRFLELSD